MFVILIFTVTISLFSNGNLFVSGECDPEKCSNYPLTMHYRDMGCEPIFSPTDSCCPIRYNCKDFAERLTAKDKCFYNGQIFKVGESIKNYRERCELGCFCNRGYKNKPAAFTCAILECGHFGPLSSNNCYFKQENSKVCCGSEYCPKSNETVHTCTLEGQTHRAGEYARPDSPEYRCKRCLCEANADNSGAEMNCNLSVDCGIELHHGAQIARTCAPIYAETGRCCPIDYKCPTSSDVIKPASTTETSNSHQDDFKCKFGQLELKIGEEIIGKKCETCRCMTPPLITCIKKDNCFSN